MDWFYAQNNRQMGPVALEALFSLLQRREVQPQDLVWREGMSDWQPAAAVPELAGAISAANGTVGYFNPHVVTQEAPVYAGFWMRFAAFIIDYLILTVVSQVAGAVLSLQMPILMRHGHTSFPMFFVLGSEGFLFYEAVGWLYYALMETSRYQATVGKIVLGLSVTDLNGNRITFGKATGRFFGKILSRLTLYIGFMMAGWTERKQALHDIIAGCLVVRKRVGF